MALKAVLDKIEGLPADVAKEYVARDGKFHLQLEGDVPGYVLKTTHDEQLVKLTEFRDNNRALNTAKTELEVKLKAFEGVDPAKYKDMETKLKNVGANDGDVASVIEKAVKAAVDPLQTKMAAYEAKDKQNTVALAQKTFESAMKDAAIKAGVDEKMLPHFVDFAQKTFKYDEATNSFQPKKGDTPIFSVKRPAEMISPEEWAASQAAEAPGFFKPSSGGGAGGGNGNGARMLGGKKVIGTDAVEFGKNIESIAKGETVVQP